MNNNTQSHPSDKPVVLKPDRGLSMTQQDFIERGTILIKYWFVVGMEEQARRFKWLIHDPFKLLEA